MNNGFFLQNILDSIAESQREIRSQEQLTLGGLIKQLSAIDENVLFPYVSDAHSFRGFYTDLAFTISEDGKTMTSKQLLEYCLSVIGSEFEGYKGGTFEMHSDTPLWNSDYGVASGLAIVGIKVSDGKGEFVIELR